MKEYATKQTFDGQRASLTRRVIVKPSESVIVVGDIFGIDVERDEPDIAVFGSDHDFRGKLRFHSTKTEADLDAMPSGTWTWPPRV
jgi:hypothetical protein